LDTVAEQLRHFRGCAGDNLSQHGVCGGSTGLPGVAVGSTRRSTMVPDDRRIIDLAASSSVSSSVSSREQFC
jgi:hypothetical protein